MRVMTSFIALRGGLIARVIALSGSWSSGCWVRLARVRGFMADGGHPYDVVSQSCWESRVYASCLVLWYMCGTSSLNSAVEPEVVATALKRKCHFDEIFGTGCTECCKKLLLLHIVTKIPSKSYFCFRLVKVLWHVGLFFKWASCLIALKFDRRLSSRVTEPSVKFKVVLNVDIPSNHIARDVHVSNIHLCTLVTIRIFNSYTRIFAQVELARSGHRCRGLSQYKGGLLTLHLYIDTGNLYT